MKLVLNDNEMNMVYEALEFWLVENNSQNAELIIDIMDKIEEELSV